MHKRRIIISYICYTAFVLVLFLIPVVTHEPFFLHIFCLIGINVIFACSIRAILNIGELNLAQATFMGIGAYASALLVMRLHISFWLAMPIAMIITAVVSLPIGLLTLRFKGAYFLLFTFLFAELVRILLSNFWIDFFGGIPGLTNIPRPSINICGLLNVDFSSGVHFYYLILILTLLSVLVMRRIDKSQIGAVLNAISQSDVLAESVGISCMKYKILGCAIGCFFAGMAGSLYAHFVRIITPPDFAIHAVLAPIAYVVVGGSGSVFGPVIGTSFLMILSHFFLRQFGLYELLIYGLIIVFIIRFLPGGLISVPYHFSSLRSKLKERPKR